MNDKNNNPAITAMHIFQEQMDGEAAKDGLNTEDDVAAWITDGRRIVSNLFGSTHIDVDGCSDGLEIQKKIREEWEDDQEEKN